MLALRIVVFAFVASLAPVAAGAQQYRSYGDWSVVCDNTRSCTAVGYAAENESNAYVIVRRAGDANALPAVQLTVVSQGRPRDRKLVAVLHGLHHPGGVPVGPLDAIADGEYARATITGPIANIFLSALRDAKTLTIRLVDHAAVSEQGIVLLDGSAAALRSMDAQQRRAGSAPRAPLVVPRVMREIATPAQPGPKLVAGADPICQTAGEMWFALAGGAKLRGVCSEGGAYNFVFRFFVVGTGRPVPANFRIPWRAPSADDASLVNPSLSKDGLILSSFTKGIGVGVCGEGADWIWTGTQFRLFRFIEMRECRGLPSEDWPVVYRARMN